MAKNKARKSREIVKTKTQGRRLSNNNIIVFVAILISAGLIGSSLLFSLGAIGSSKGANRGGTSQGSASLISSYQEALKKNPNDMATRESLGVEYFTAGTGLYSQGKANEGQRQLELAIVEFEKVAAKAPKNAPVLGDLATSYFYTGKTDKAIETGKKALEADPNLAPARLNLGIFLANKQQYVQAIAELKKVPAGTTQASQAKDMIKQYQDILAGGKGK